MTNTAASTVVSLIAARLSSQVLTSESPSVLPLMTVREQMLTAHPTPSSLTIRVAPSGKVIFAINPDKCPCRWLASPIRDGAFAPLTAKLIGTRRPAVMQLVRSMLVFISFFLLPFVEYCLDVAFVLALVTQANVNGGNTAGFVDDERGW